MSTNKLIDAPGNLGPMMRLAAPVLAEETLTLMVTWTDWWLTGRYLTSGGDSVKAAMGLMGYTMWLIPSLFAAVAIGATAVIARRTGERDHDAAKLAANQAVLVGGGVAIVITSLAILLGDQFIHAMQLRGEAARYASEYLWIVIPVIPLIMFEQVGAACLRGAGDTVTGFVAKLVVVIVNVAISLVLVLGIGGIEPWGWKGIALGTAIGHGVGGTILFTALLMNRYGLGLRPHLLRPVKSVIVRLLKIGLPGGLDVAALLFSNLIFVAIINSLGTAAAAAHGLAVQLEACAYLPANAFHVAAATMTGQFLGAGRTDRAIHSALFCIGSSVVVISITALGMFFFGTELATFFTGQPEHPTTLQVGRLLAIVAFALPSLAIVMVTTGALRGAGDTTWPLLFTLAGFFLMRIPLAIVFAMETVHIPGTSIQFPGLGWGVAGAWIAMVIDLVVRSILVLSRFIHGGWKYKDV
ncbi:MAG: MATE family efflux transporter [Pirellulaceae bacterium]